MMPQPSRVEATDDEDARRVADTRAEVQAGRVVSNDEVCAWLETWGTPDEKPAPRAWLK